MKKYIKPIAKLVIVDNESLMLSGSLNEGEGYGDFANQGTWEEDEEEDTNSGW